MSTPRFEHAFATAEEFLEAWETEFAAGGFLVRGATLPPGAGLGPCVLVVKVKGFPTAETHAQIGAAVPGAGVAVIFPTPPPAVAALAEKVKARATDEEESSSTLMTERLKSLSVAEKMQLALSGDREARAYLLRDTNKSIHQYVLRNPRIGLDEVLYAAKMSTLSPDALKMIAEHKEWGASPQICAALARNPKTPVPLAVRILPRVPIADLKAIAKGTGRAPIVQAARKIVNEQP